MKRLALFFCAMATLSCAGPDTSSRPEARPNPVADASIDRSALENEQGGFFRSLRPFLRSSNAAPAQSQPVAGSVCGDTSIRGEVIGVWRAAYRDAVWKMLLASMQFPV
jgi:hypothetical protein